MDNMNVFVYYGCEIDKHDYENLVNKFSVKDLYSRIYSAGLEFKEVGDSMKSWRYVIGKEIIWNRDSVLNLKYESNDFYTEDNNIKLSVEDESEVRRKLLQIGISNIPSYKIFTSWY